VTQDRRGSAGEDGGEAMPVRPEDRMPDRVDGTVHAVETSRADAPADGAVAQPERRQLPAPDHAVLRRRKGRDALIG
jgi:hypothetical protein